MASPATAYPSSAATLQRDKLTATARPPKRKVNPLSLVAIAAIILLCASAGWRLTHSAPRSTMIRMVAASKDLPPGISIEFGHLRYLDVPKELATRDMTGSIADVIGHTTRTFVAAGQPIRQPMVFAAAGGISKNIAADERAITLELSDDTLVDHAIEPDDRVDVLVVSAKDTGKFTKTISQSARVLVAAPKEQMLARHLGAAALNKITLAVKPEVAETITEAAEVGKIRLVLRARTNKQESLLFGSDPDDLLPHSALARTSPADTLANAAVPSAPPPTALPPPPAPPPPSAAQAAADPIEWLVQVFSGSRKETVSVPQN